MFNWRLNPYLIAVGIIALLSGSYLGYRAYQDHVEFEVFLSDAEEFQLAHATVPTPAAGLTDWQTEQRGRSSVGPTSGLANNQTGQSNTRRVDISKMVVKVKLMPPEKVAKYSHGDPNGSVVVRNSPSPIKPGNRTWTQDDMVTQFLELPNGTVVETRIPAGMEIREGDEVSSKYVAIHTPPENTVEIDGAEHKIPPGADRHQHLQKLFWSHELGITVEEAERMVVNRELIVKPEGESLTFEEEGIMARLLNKIPRFASFLQSERPDLYEAEPVRDGPQQSPPENRGIEPGGSDPSSSLFPSSPSEFEPVPQGKIEEQAPIQSEPPVVSSQETESREGLSRAQQLIDQYGTEEGLRRLREMDPEAARQFERERKPPPARDESKTR